MSQGSESHNRLVGSSNPCNAGGLVRRLRHLRFISFVFEDKTAANFLVEMGGDIHKFECSGKIIAMAGLNPAVYQSGKHAGKGRITKRGNRHLRRIIWMMTTGVIQYTDIFKTYYQKRRKEGLPYKKAVLATAHKLIRVIYAILTQRETFCPQLNS